nr:hypothetical protein [Maliibacterium massiliense]
MAKKEKKWPMSRILSTVLLVTLVLSIVFLIVRIFAAPGGRVAAHFAERSKGDYIQMAIQCLLGIVVLYLPGVVAKRTRIEIPSVMHCMYVVFLYCSIYLGEIKNFYYDLPHFDTLLHGFSGVMLGALAFCFIALLNRSERVPVDLSPAFVAIFAFCFSMTLGALWEIYEFSFDGILGMNMQKYMLEDGTQLLGKAALADTMKDLIVDAVGALVASVVGYISIKRNKGLIDKIQIKKLPQTGEDA